MVKVLASAGETHVACFDMMQGVKNVTSWDKNVDLSPVVPLPMSMKTFMSLLENFLRNTIK